MSTAMRRFRITYRDVCDPGCPEMEVTFRGYDAAHAQERFMESPDSDGWEICSCRLVEPRT